MNNITLLGSGDTLGTPVYGSHTDSNTVDRRTRFGILIRHGERRLLIDTNPDLKWQCLAAGFALSDIDAVLITHTHSDHLNGMGEFWQRRPNPTVVHYPADPLSGKHIDYFRYLEREKVLTFQPFTPWKKTELWPGCFFTPVELNHGFPCFGFLIELDGKRIGVMSDSNAQIAQQSLNILTPCDLLFVDAFSENIEQVQTLYRELQEPIPESATLAQSWFHMTLDEAQGMQMRVGATTACTVHMSRFMAPHAELVRRYQSDIFLIGFDGLTIPL